MNEIPSKTPLEKRLEDLGVFPEDLLETFARSSGPGGQNVNKVSTCVTLRHVPTGIQIKVQDSRSQFTNRTLARERLAQTLENKDKERTLAGAALRSKKRRQKAKRSKGTQRAMVADKRQRGEIKRLRGNVKDE